MQLFQTLLKIAQVPAVIDDKLLKPFTEVVHGFADHRARRPGTIEQLTFRNRASYV